MIQADEENQLQDAQRYALSTQLICDMKGEDLVSAHRNSVNEAFKPNKALQAVSSLKNMAASHAQEIVGKLQQYSGEHGDDQPQTTFVSSKAVEEKEW